MNRYTLLGSQFDTTGQEWAYVFDSSTGETFKSPVRVAGAQTIKASNGQFIPPNVFIPNAPTPAVNNSTQGKALEPVILKEKGDPSGEMETPEERALRLKSKKVPPAFLGGIDRMGLDPAKNANGITDVTPTH